MNDRDRISPIIFESGLKTLLGQAGNNYPLINGQFWPRDCYGYLDIRMTSNNNNALIVSSTKPSCSNQTIQQQLNPTTPDNNNVQQSQQQPPQQQTPASSQQNYFDTTPTPVTTTPYPHPSQQQQQQRDTVMCDCGGASEMETQHQLTTAPGQMSSGGWTTHTINWVQNSATDNNYNCGQQSNTCNNVVTAPYPLPKRPLPIGNNKPAHSHGLHSGLKDLAASGLLDDKKDDSDLWGNVEAQTAFLGPNLWDKSYDTDLKYVDLDEFLSENGVSMDGIGSHLGSSGSSGGGGGSGGSSMASHGLPKRERSPSPSDCMSPDTLNPPSPADSTLSMASSGRDFDPRTRAFSDEELKPQPMIKKSRKQFVPDDLKDDKYWARRRKNNMAAKRSRDARRMKENQIALRAGYLEKENMGLRQEIERLKKENHLLRDKLAKYTDV